MSRSLNIEDTIQAMFNVAVPMLANRAVLALVADGAITRVESHPWVAEDAPEGDHLRIPLHTGIAGAAATSGKPVRVADAYADPRFNRAVDAETGFRTRSMLCRPLHDHEGNVFAVTQLLNRRDGKPFDDHDERRYTEFAASLSVLLETLVGLGRRASIAS